MAPSPKTVRDTRALARQREKARKESARYATARRNGYHGPVTRNDLAAQCERTARS